MTEIGGVHQGTSHGFEFHTEIPLAGLRGGSSTRLVVEEREVEPTDGIEVGRWDDIPGKRVGVSVHETAPRRYLVQVGTMGRFAVDTEAKEVGGQFRVDMAPMLRTTVLMSTPLALCISDAGRLAIHAGAVDIGNRGVVLAARGSGGKTTLTAAFHISGHRVLSDDLSGIAPEGSVTPAPALLRLRPDAADRLAPLLPDADGSFEASGKRFFEIAPERRGDGSPVELAAIFLLEWADDDTIALERVPPALAIQEMWGLSFYLSGDGGPATCFDRLATLLDHVPTFRLARPRDFSRLPETVERIVEQLGVPPA